ncbi:MAG: PIN domain nuclease [Candidatus Firestonebacteria bacterium]|nr:PIN domain nuclease [Candidatus Firestonebacteria bacterium]
MILIDTSVWIDFFNHPQSYFSKLLKELIEKDTDLCLTDIILTEILQGIKDDVIFEETKKSLLAFPIFKAASLNTYIYAAAIYRICRNRGTTIRRTIDTIIASVAIENNLQIFHNDKDFNRIAQCTPLKIFRSIVV